MSCVRCVEAGTNVRPVQQINPILLCSICHRAWHYKCIIPPMPEHELTSRVTASASHIIDDSLEDWICRHCSKKSAYRGIGQPRQFTSAMALTDEVEIISSTDSEPLRTSGQAWKGKSRAHSSTAPTVISNVIDLTSDSPGESAVDSPVKQVLMANRTKASQHSSHLRTNNPKGAPFMVSPFSHNRSCSNAHNLHQPSSKCNTRSSGGSFSTPHLDSLLNKSSLCNQTQPPQSIPSSTPSPNSVFLPSPTSGGSSAPTSPFTSPAPEVVKSVQSATAASKVFNLKTLIQDMRASGKLNPPPKSLWEEIVEARTSDAENPTPSTSSHHSKPIEIDVDDINMINDTTELRNVHNRFSDRVASSDIPMDIDVEDNQKDSSVKSRANHKRFVRLGGLPPRRQPHDTMTTVKVEEEIPRILPSGTHSRRGRKMFEAKKLGPKARKRRQGDLLVIC